MLLEDLMQPCPACEVPYEYGEEACSSCLAWLTSTRALDSSSKGYFARQRRTRFVTTWTKAILLTSLAGLVLIQMVLLFGVVDIGAYRDITFVVPHFVLIIGGLVAFGAPGRALNHYAGDGFLRRGRPRWWKDILSGAALIALAIAAGELFLRPILESRASRTYKHSPAEIAEVIVILNCAVYVAVAVMLLWFFIVHCLGPQDLVASRRKQLMQRQKQHAEPSNAPRY